MSIERVREVFRREGIEDRIREFETSSATVELAAEALHCEPCRIAKSLAISVKGEPVLVVAAGDARIDNHRFKEQFGAKGKMLSAEETLSVTGHAVGGVCPFALNDGVKVFLDVSLRRFDTVFPACGSSNSAAEFTCEELEKYSGAEGWVDVCRLPE
ncbi:MAG: YbaK/EbsC family protein [Oscillospiraceae bacterium]|nr:YbaK/EbsC family protein [Oscillospiraceae bacterium]